MGLPNNSDMYISEQDFRAVKCNFFQELDHSVKSSAVSGGETLVKCAVSREEHRMKSAFTLKIKVSGPGEAIKFEEKDCKTPTDASPDDKKIRLKCPPAPRKPKSVPSAKRSRKDERILLDLSNEIESLFPPALLKDLLSGKIKKVRKDSGIM